MDADDYDNPEAGDLSVADFIACYFPASPPRHRLAAAETLDKGCPAWRATPGRAKRYADKLVVRTRQWSA